jgi:hypothetical protein
MNTSIRPLAVFFTLLICTPSITKAQNVGPTEAFVGMYVISVDNVDVKQQSFDAEFYLWLKWKGACSPERFELQNARNLTKIFEVKGKDSLGYQYISARMHATFRGELDVSKFPLDKHVRNIDMEDFDWTDSNLVYIIDDLSTGTGEQMKGSEWKITAIGPSVSTRRFDPEQAKFSHYRYSLSITRRFLPFLIKVLIPLLVVVAMSMLSFFIPAEDLQTQASIGATALLSIIAFHLAVSGQLPDVGYLTVTDILMMGTYLFIFSALVESVWVNALSKRGCTDTANRIDRMCRVRFPVGYLIFLGILCLIAFL